MPFVSRPDSRPGLRSALILALVLVAPSLLGTSAVANAPAPQIRFERPTVTGGAVAWCLDGATGCGAPAATAWCQWRGFADATAFERDAAPASGATSLGTGATCQGETCSAFRSITCVGMPSAPGATL